MVRIARDRVSILFALAESEATTGHPELADRYVRLARRIGMRYNVRLLAEYREVYCRECSSFWVEGRTVRTRLRSGHRVRTCLRCGRERRTRIRAPRPPIGTVLGADATAASRPVQRLPEFPSVGDEESDGDDESEDP
jgi:ribonuclease P protein subunit RPR2